MSVAPSREWLDDGLEIGEIVQWPLQRFGLP